MRYFVLVSSMSALALVVACAEDSTDAPGPDPTAIVDAGPVDASSPDGWPRDMATVDARPMATPPVDASPVDATSVDANAADVSAADAIAADTNGTDANEADAIAVDAGAADAMSADAGPNDAGPNDADSAEPLAPDASPVDGGEHALPTGLIRVHIVSSEVEALDAAGIYVREDLDVFLAHMNETFAPVGIRWDFESIRFQRALDEQAYLDAVAAEQTGAAPLKRNVDPAEMLAPNGWDMFVVRQTFRLGFGGVYVCSVNGEAGMGTVFVPLLDRMGQPQTPRKWSHEQGHATGLPHPPCEEAYIDNLMTSGSCRIADVARMDLNQVQIDRILEQFDIGGPPVCGAIDPETYE